MIRNPHPPPPSQSIAIESLVDVCRGAYPRGIHGGSLRVRLISLSRRLDVTTRITVIITSSKARPFTRINRKLNARQPRPKDSPTSHK